jgi:hypothetical protein
MKKVLFVLIGVFVLSGSFAQTSKEKRRIIRERLDSLYIGEVEDKHGADKVLHAEPLYIDLIRDLGARKGEQEWNVGVGLTDNINYDKYEALVEYEFAPINRLGLEVELPFTFYFPTNRNTRDAPKSKLNSIKLAGQYSFFVSEKIKTSMAFGYIQEIELVDFTKYGSKNFVPGLVYNPFYVLAKRWGQNFHTLLYSGPRFTHHFYNNSIDMVWQINTSLSYMITGTRNFVGIEFNKELSNTGFDMTIRPQMRIGLADNFMVGIVTGIPIDRQKERFSAFMRLIYEPGHRQLRHKH